MEIYRKEIKVLSSYCDYNRKLRLSELLKFTQEASIEHTTLMGMGREKTLDKGLLWIISKQHYEISSLPKYDDSIELLSHAGETRFILLPRHYEIDLKSTGEALVKGSAIWGLIDKESRQPILPLEHGIEIIPCVMGNEVDIPLSIKVPQLEKEAEIEAKYSLCDLNGHLNNASYIDLVMDLIPMDYLDKHEPKTLDIVYKKEIRLGEKVTLSYGERDNSWYFFCPRFTIRIEFRGI